MRVKATLKEFKYESEGVTGSWMMGPLSFFLAKGAWQLSIMIQVGTPDKKIILYRGYTMSCITIA